MGSLPSLGGKAAHLVSYLATIILNPVSERERQQHHPSHLPVNGPLPPPLFNMQVERFARIYRSYVFEQLID
jgi:hypothetical protein